MNEAWFESGHTQPPTPGFVADKCDVSGDQVCALGDVGRVPAALGAGRQTNPLVLRSPPRALR